MMLYEALKRFAVRSINTTSDGQEPNPTTRLENTPGFRDYTELLSAKEISNLAMDGAARL